MSIESTSTSSALCSGRPFTSNTRATASESRAPRPRDRRSSRSGTPPAHPPPPPRRPPRSRARRAPRDPPPGYAYEWAARSPETSQGVMADVAPAVRPREAAMRVDRRVSAAGTASAQRPRRGLTPSTRPPAVTTARHPRGAVPAWKTCTLGTRRRAPRPAMARARLRRRPDNRRRHHHAQRSRARTATSWARHGPACRARQPRSRASTSSSSARQKHLGLRIAEAAVEFDTLGPSG